jgi:hypothetical protein
MIKGKVEQGKCCSSEQCVEKETMDGTLGCREEVDHAYLQPGSDSEQFVIRLHKSLDILGQGMVRSVSMFKYGYFEVRIH